MRVLLTIIGTLGAIALSTNVGAAELFDPAKNQLVLLEFTVDATDRPVKAVVTCSQDEIKKAVENLVSFSATKNNALRDLKPTYRPLDNDAAWIVKQEECPSLKPYLNGIGFDSYDAKTGEAVIYVAAFNVVPETSAQWREASGLERMRFIFQPEYNAINVEKFPAKCALNRTGTFARLGYGGQEMVCTLEAGKGSVKFDVKARE